MTRAFVGIDIPEHIITVLQPVQDRLPMGRIVPPENLHLTLCFLGDVSDPALEAVHERLSALHQPGVDITLSGLDWIGGAHPRAIVAGVVPHDGLTALHRAVLGACHGAGVVVERRRFVPHVTLARLGKARASAALNDVVLSHRLTPFGAFRAHGFTLYQSDLRPEGAVYTPLASYPLRSEAR
ncbi:RNA 2',3'-cyclic phosphodiesterase [Actibacterium ureilyticum]|uniref:RNA 2',3'-cyclic phosphodiesterase n=1 Tax=Actibacterium ureilyticum TaxID=1590614 RepID=UPI000BAB03EC|nr:RNA 2',3'-cyclic phosphodiesterase [Actibacterium ureilyticum]